MDYGKTIKELRILKTKQNQTEFANNIDITQSYLSSIENGNKKPSIDLLEKIAEYVKLPMPILFWKSMSEEDIAKEKRESFNQLKSSIDALVMSFF